MDHPNPLITFEEYRQHVWRWHWYHLPEGADEAEREAYSLKVEEEIRSAWEARRQRLLKRSTLKEKYVELTFQHLNFRE